MANITEQSKPYEPELDQIMFDTPTDEFELGKLERWAVSNLQKIAQLTKVEGLGDNTGGHGVKFQNDVFVMQNYHWCNEGDDCKIAEMPNFKCGDIEIRWYKYLGRGMSVNRQVTKEELTEAFQKCRDSLTSTT